ncbi:Uncharacterized protein FWK35_00006312 [Aphis craccivora]|uniref:Uncharacterized protein n=1 Tax=Aphis craccivora TaxID=307492 RepID=A0A6G0YUL5_APHCR|nr:Uncharacterized protein FWK35_00006312 [Aphis craccivora]
MDTENDDMLFCRFCLRQTQSSFPIFMASDPDLAKDVMNCLQIKITKDSVGPKHICNECYDRVQDWVMFKKQSEDALKEINFNSDLVKKEPVSTVSLMSDLIDEVDYHCCISCDNIFPNEYELSVHVMEVHQDIVDTNSKFGRDESMDIQSMIIDDNDFIQCDDYLEVFNDRSSSFKINNDEFKNKQIIDDAEEKFQCYYCSAKFDEFVHLKEHSVARHRDLNKKTECNQCNKIFLTVSDLQRHVKQTHPTKKDRDLSESTSLRPSKRSPYTCHLCDKTFSRFCDLLDHDEIQHDDLPKKYRCGVCSKMFLMEDRAKVHFNFYHTKTKGSVNFQCSYCGMELKSASAVANHERMHITHKSSKIQYNIIRD